MSTSSTIRQTSKTKTTSSKRSGRGLRNCDFPAPPTLIQNVKTARGVMNHTYRDFSQVPPSPDYTPVAKIDDMTFAEKVHSILAQPQFAKAISWMPHGRCFKVHVPKEFENNVLPVYFGHGRYSSFLRDLNKHGFKHLSKGTDRNCYYHEFMLRGRFHLCRYMPRCKDARRLDADPTNEPDFYKISASFPVNDIVSPTVTQKVPVNNISSSIPTLAGPIKQAVVPPSLGQDTSMAQLVAAIQALQNTNNHQALPCPAPILSAPSPQPASPPLEQLVALVSSVQTTASTPAPLPFPVNNKNNTSNAMLPMLLQVLLASNGNLGTTTTPPPQGQPQPSKSNDPLGVLASLLQKQQQEQQEASARLALALALAALNKA